MAPSEAWRVTNEYFNLARKDRARFYNRPSLQQSRAGMPDEGLGIAAIGLEHFETAVSGHIGDLDQVGAALHRGGYEARPQAVAGKGRGLEPELGGAGLHDRCDIAGGEAPIRDALCALVEDTTEDSASAIPATSSRSASSSTSSAPSSLRRKAPRSQAG